MDPITGTAFALAILAGFGAGWGLKPDDATEALQAQTATLTEVYDGQQQLLELGSRPVVIDAELRSTLAEVPVQCRADAGGDPNSVQCQWATCLQYGQSSAQRPECREVEALMVAALTGCPD